MSSRIIVTRPGGFVTVVCPSYKCVRFLATGGRWERWSWQFLEHQIARRIAAGHDPAAARALVFGLAFGGLDEATAVDLIARDGWAHRGTGLEIWDVGQVPDDRWFRNAWRRDSAGGPIRIDLDAARLVQQSRVAAAVAAWNESQRLEPALWGHNGPRLIDVDYRVLRSDCAAARTLEELRAVWPLDLPAQPPLRLVA